jgi:outer membrane biosynthesis protein TonB
MFWLIDNIEFVIQGVPNFGIDQVLPLGIKINETGVFSIKINKLENVADNVNIYLKNLQDSTYFDLRKGDYSMNLDPGNYYESFQIVFQKEKVPPEEPDPVEETEEETEEEPDPVVETEEESEEESVEEVIAEEEQEQEAVETAGDEEILDGGIKVFYVGNNREIAVLNPSKFKIERIVIYDMLGQIIQEYQNISNEKEVRLPVREFPAAVYAIKLYSGNKEISKSIILIR